MKFKLDTEKKTIQILDDAVSLKDLERIVTQYLKPAMEWKLIINEAKKSTINHNPWTVDNPYSKAGMQFENPVESLKTYCTHCKNSLTI
jgi:hypothetical protein